MSTCDQLDLEPLGFQSDLPKNIPGHWLALLVLGGGFMHCPNVGAKFKTQYLSHICPIWWGFFSLGTR